MLNLMQLLYKMGTYHSGTTGLGFGFHELSMDLDGYVFRRDGEHCY
jgi:hypothetical protein